MSATNNIPASTEAEDPLMTPVQFVPGVGPQRAPLLARLNIKTVRDLLLHVPHSVNDFSDLRPAHRLEADIEQSVLGRVVDRDLRMLSKGRTLVGILLDCEGQFVRGTWFNQPWMLKKFQDHEAVIFSGKPQRKAGRWEFGNPRVHWLAGDDDASDLESAVGVLPRYPLTDGIRMDQMRQMTRAAVEGYARYMADPLPEPFLAHHRLPDLPTALKWLHTPDTRQQFDDGRKRLVLDDLLEFQLGLALRRRVWGTRSTAWPIPVTALVDARIRRLFEFRFTKGQDTVVRELVADLEKKQPMHRLLQADVGAGKTAIAVYAMLAAVACGHQAVLMAPTEVLATQHWETFEELLAHSRVKRGFLVGGLPAAERRQLLADISSGECQLIVGTQAVIQESVKFRQLALAVIDEQHRFGVRQRASFGSVSDSDRAAGKSDPRAGAANRQPHVLVMTATPIPRSLCLTRFGDLDISTIRELPPGRQKVITSRLQNQVEQNRAWEFIRQQVGKGRQAYVVCPRVEGQSEEDDAAAETVFQRLRRTELQDLKVDLLHGRMDRQMRREVMERFRQQEIQVLVSTTVVEVGVNVPNATLMVILQAERFGLAQLHQLRGRICRGSYQGYCFLISDAETPDAIERLKAMEESSDGFKLAERDAELRGPGDVLGTRQSGSLPLRVANPVRDIQLLQVARRMAHDLVRTGEFDTPEYHALKAIVLERFAHVLDLPQTG
ncbi:MAG: ATP-dependent DNA helicase RecG [Planctomycetaceae bacterium]|nr:ATP-dependent DNA helicase RecG [Planctomycetaceae bacterium]